ncbi:hypothetical protein [Cognatishimia sp.]|uniref:hypothetical protein n=1 Tax=Cognatishimia sp. TaxID=2211648 RepID=UPI003517C72A|nr:hypothetical protein [Cognatishimia sp.]
MIEPDPSCKYIDKALLQVDELKNLIPFCDFPDLEGVIDKIVNDIEWNMEKARDINSELRDYGNYWKEEYFELEKTYEDMKER